MDMFMQSKNIVNKKVITKIVDDKFHFIRQVDYMIRDIPIRLFNSDKEFYKNLKKHWIHLNLKAIKLSEKIYIN